MDGCKTTIWDLTRPSLLKSYSQTASASTLKVCLHGYRTFAAWPPSRCLASLWRIISPPASTFATLSASAHSRCTLWNCYATTAWATTRWGTSTSPSSSQLLYASPALWSFTCAVAKQRLKASVRRAIRLGLYTADDPTPSQLVAEMDDNLFANILNNPHHVLHIFSRTKLIILTILDLVVILCHKLSRLTAITS